MQQRICRHLAKRTPPRNLYDRRYKIVVIIVIIIISNLRRIYRSLVHETNLKALRRFCPHVWSLGRIGSGPKIWTRVQLWSTYLCHIRESRLHGSTCRNMFCTVRYVGPYSHSFLKSTTFVDRTANECVKERHSGITPLSKLTLAQLPPR